MLGPGDRAPRFRLKSNKDDYVALDDFQGKNLVLYFYPKDNTVGCTREARSFRHAYRAFQKLDAEIIGISSDSVSSHKKFAEDENLPFPLLSDSKGAVRKAYGVKSTLGIIPGRCTFVVNKQGLVVRVYSAQSRPEEHVKEALAALHSLDAVRVSP
jgi:peroxiredoxin Q/BCP